jgi:hypothetical protein
MTKKIQTLCLIFLLTISLHAFAQTENQLHAEIQVHSSDGVASDDLMNVLRFQGINHSKVTFTGKGLWGKDYKIFIRDFSNGKLVKTHQLFDSKEEEFFRIKEQEFSFSVLVQRLPTNKAKFLLSFIGFQLNKEIDLGVDQKDFALKSFQGSLTSAPVPINKVHSFLSFMMPYKLASGASIYCDVLQSGVAPEELGKKYSIPRYFLIDIKFE